MWRHFSTKYLSTGRRHRLSLSHEWRNINLTYTCTKQTENSPRSTIIIFSYRSEKSKLRSVYQWANSCFQTRWVYIHTSISIHEKTLLICEQLRSKHKQVILDSFRTIVLYPSPRGRESKKACRFFHSLTMYLILKLQSGNLLFSVRYLHPRQRTCRFHLTERYEPT